MIRNQIKSYFTTDVLTADPHKLVLMCYEGAIFQLRVAKNKMAEKELEAKTKAINKSQDIISELAAVLDFEKGGAIAKNLDALYNYIQRRLLQAGLNDDTEAIDEVIGILHELASAWEQIGPKKNQARIPQTENYSQTPPAPAYA